jgi:hypothetical protein
MQKLHLYIYISLAIILPGFQPEVPAATSVAKFAGEFLSTGVGARALGMGGAHVAVGADVTAGYWNPAGLIGIRAPQVSLMHSSRFDGIVKYDYGAAALPFGSDQTFAISLIRLAVDDIAYTALPNPELPLSETNQPIISRIVNDAEYALFFSYARVIPGKFSYGANIKLINKGVGDNSAWGLGFDIGVLMNPVASLLVGANLQDATTTLVSWDTKTNELISPTLKLGFAYPVNLPFLTSKLIPALDIDTRFENRGSTSQASIGPASFDAHLGVEYVLFRAVAFRVGSDVGHFTAGAGLRLPQLYLDYAFMVHDLGDTHRISLKISIEKEKLRTK